MPLVLPPLVVGDFSGPWMSPLPSSNWTVNFLLLFVSLAPDLKSQADKSTGTSEDPRPGSRLPELRESQYLGLFGLDRGRWGSVFHTTLNHQVKVNGKWEWVCRLVRRSLFCEFIHGPLSCHYEYSFCRSIKNKLGGEVSGVPSGLKIWHGHSCSLGHSCVRVLFLDRRLLHATGMAKKKKKKQKNKPKKLGVICWGDRSKFLVSSGHAWAPAKFGTLFVDEVPLEVPSFRLDRSIAPSLWRAILFNGHLVFSGQGFSTCSCLQAQEQFH